VSIGRINRPGAPSGEQAHLEGLRDELEPGEFIVGDHVCRTQWVRGWALMMPVRRWRTSPQLFDPVANARAAARIVARPCFCGFERADDCPRHGTPSLKVNKFGGVYSIARGRAR
jgi:hypothetical protein